MVSYTTRLSGLCMLVAAVFLLQTGCSHQSPFYRKKITRSESATIAEPNIEQRILLIGDAGEPGFTEPVLTTLREWAGIAPDKTTVIFLGDNIYPDGLPPADDTSKRDEAVRKLSAQMEAIRVSKARGLWIPGNHDWARGRAGGFNAVKRQEAFIHRHPSGPYRFLPQGGAQVRLTLISTLFV